MCTYYGYNEQSVINKPHPTTLSLTDLQFKFNTKCSDVSLLIHFVIIFVLHEGIRPFFAENFGQKLIDDVLSLFIENVS